MSARAKVSATDLTNRMVETDKNNEAVRQQVKEQMSTEAPIRIKMVSEQVVGEQLGDSTAKDIKN